MHTLYHYELETFNIRISLAVSLACPTATMIMNNKINKLRIAMKKSTKPIEGDILIIRIQALEWVQGRIQDLIRPQAPF